MATKAASDIEIKRHSLAHVLAMAVLRIYPESKIGIGPANEKGFYYDIDIPEKVTDHNLDAIEEEMRKIIKEEMLFKQLYLPREQAYDTLLQLGQTYKTELLQSITDEQISFYQTGEFLDLCRGPHVKHTGLLNYFKLTGISVVHWLNDEQRPQMYRIEGVAFETEEELAAHLKFLAELNEKNYIKLGKSLELLTVDPKDKLISFSENGNAVITQIKNLCISHLESSGFKIVNNPMLINTNNIANPDKSSLAVKINNCNYLIKSDSLYYHNKEYMLKKRGYKELPFKIAEISDYVSPLNEESNQGINYTACQSHVYTNNDSVEFEIKQSIKLISELLSILGFDHYLLYAIMPEDVSNKKHLSYLQKSMNIYEKILNDMKLVARVLPSKYSKYGPQIVFSVKDIFGRPHYIASVTLDLVTPAVEGMTYVNFENRKNKIYIIHLNIIQSIQEVFALILENYGGVLPIWLSPIQAIIVPISEKYEKEAFDVYKKLAEKRIRASIDKRNKTMQYRIHSAQKKHIPYILIIGEKEHNTDSISVRLRNGQELGLIRVEEFINKILEEINTYDRSN